MCRSSNQVVPRSFLLELCRYIIHPVTTASSCVKRDRNDRHLKYTVWVILVETKILDVSKVLEIRQDVTVSAAT
jgi:hypothetical protein